MDILFRLLISRILSPALRCFTHQPRFQNSFNKVRRIVWCGGWRSGTSIWARTWEESLTTPMIVTSNHKTPRSLPICSYRYQLWERVCWQRTLSPNMGDLIILLDLVAQCKPSYTKTSHWSGGSWPSLWVPFHQIYQNQTSGRCIAVWQGVPRHKTQSITRVECNTTAAKLS